MGDVTTEALFKCDVSGDSCVTDSAFPSSDYADNFSIDLSLNNGDGESIGGTFSFSDLGQDILYPRFFTLKAGNQFAIFEIESSDYQGTSLFDISFSTDDVTLNGRTGRGLSNLAFYDSMNPPGNPGTPEVPLPAASLLLLSGLAGLGGFGYARRRKTAAA